MSENWELVDHNTMTGIKRYIGTGDEDDTVLVKTEFDPLATRSILNNNKAEQNEDFDRSSDMWKVASIPPVVMYEWLTKYGVNFWNPAHRDGVTRLLNSDEYRWCKVKDVII